MVFLSIAVCTSSFPGVPPPSPLWLPSLSAPGSFSSWWVRTSLIPLACVFLCGVLGAGAEILRSEHVLMSTAVQYPVIHLFL